MCCPQKKWLEELTINALVFCKISTFLWFFIWIPGYGMTERMTKPTPAPTSAEELDINFYMNKLRTIRANCGLENADVSFFLLTSQNFLCFEFQNCCSKLFKFRLLNYIYIYVLNLDYFRINLFTAFQTRKYVKKRRHARKGRKRK